MAKMTDEQRAVLMIEILDSFCPEDKKDFMKHFSSTAQTNDKERFIEALSAVMTGVRYSYWPWVPTERISAK